MSKKPLIASIVGMLCVAAYMGSWALSQPKFTETLAEDLLAQVEVAPLDQAVTLAVVKDAGVLLITAASVEGVEGVPLNQFGITAEKDAVDAFLMLGHDRLIKIIGQSEASHFAWEALSVPVQAQGKHIAAGTNYMAHAKEVGHEGEPFLFPKLSIATGWQSKVKAGTRLDHEVELCAVPLKDYSLGEQAQLGYLLCGDFTDRWQLVKDIDASGDMGKTGFPVAKGGDTRFPVGPFLVIPTDTDFYKTVEMKLYVNTKLRQQAAAERMVWDPVIIMNKALEDCGSQYQLHDKALTIIDSCAAIAAKTIVLTGTPEGVMFHLATLWNPAFYLQQGDVVTAYSRYLGITRNTID
ncbi:hypothetical protein R50073_47140 [Maricurvus nonylphenolicus]|uniref:fumarylacetoacetate hydrolase family protein n=1 Tax=Maricurvus nonylphenolicus TaxID=1008307 RepID=UPI0036F2565D